MFAKECMGRGVIWLAALFTALPAGCAPAPIVGGTAGKLTSEGNPLPDVQVNLYLASTGERVGYGITAADGSFELIAGDSSGPLELPLGSYVVTLESVGAPVEFPPPYTRPDATPLRVDWEGTGGLDLQVPGIRLP